MESIYPISHPSADDFDRAEKDYAERFGVPAPGSGRSEARYQAIVLALEINAPATERDVDAFRIPGPLDS